MCGQFRQFSARPVGLVSALSRQSTPGPAVRRFVFRCATHSHKSENALGAIAVGSVSGASQHHAGLAGANSTANCIVFPVASRPADRVVIFAYSPSRTPARGSPRAQSAVLERPWARGGSWASLRRGAGAIRRPLFPTLVAGPPGPSQAVQDAFDRVRNLCLRLVQLRSARGAESQAFSASSSH